MTDNTVKVSCPSCASCFEVTDPELIGQIVACPKCGGMMLVAPPEEEPAAELEETPGAREPESPTSEPEPAALRQNAKEPFEPENAPAPQDEGQEQREAIERRRISRAFAAVAGVFCAVVFVSVVSFVVAWRRTAPEVGDPGARVVQNETESDVKSGSVENTDPDESVEEGKEEELAQNDPDPDADATESEEESDPLPEDDVADILEPDPESAEEIDTGLLGDDAALTEDEVSPADDLVADDELDEGDDALPTEFNQEEFDRANTAQADEEAEIEERDSDDIAFAAPSVDTGAATAFPVLKTTRREIDVEERLKLRIRSITFPDSPAAAVRLLSEFADVPIAFDLDRISALRPSLNMTLDQTLDDVSAGDALDRLAAVMKWKALRKEDGVLIEPADYDSPWVEEKFDVADLVGPVAPVRFEENQENAPATGKEEPASITPEFLVEMAESLLIPDAGDEAEERPSIRAEGNEIIVRGDAEVRRSAGFLFERLRILKGLEPKTATPIEVIFPENLGWSVLRQKTSFNLFKPVSLQQALEILENKFQFLILWDDAALSAAGVGRESTTLARIESAAIDQTIADLLDPLKMSCVILDEKIFLVTTKEKAEAHRTVETFGYDEPGAKPNLKKALEMIEEMTAAVAPGTWRQEGVVVWIDPEASCWIIRQSEPVQRDVRRWLTGKKGKSAKSSSRAKKTDPEQESEKADAEETEPAGNPAENPGADETTSEEPAEEGALETEPAPEAEPAEDGVEPL